MLASFLITFRESLEAFLIIGVVLAYLDKSRRKAFEKTVLTGAALGVVASVLTAIVFNLLAISLDSLGWLFEGAIMLAAALMIAYVVFWMNRKDLKKHIESKAEENATKTGLFALAFFSVYREGVETTLFLQASIYSSPANASATGALLGIAIALALVFLLFKTSMKLKLKTLFAATSVFLALFSAGLFAHAVHEFETTGLLPATTIVWDSSFLLNEESTGGQIAKSLFGYAAKPLALDVIAYFAFLTVIGLIIFHRKKKQKGEIH